MAYKTVGQSSSYIRSLIPQQRDDLLSEIERHAEDKRIPILLPEAVGFLQQLALLKQPRRILEIGTATGYSGILLLQACHGHLDTVDMSRECIDIAEQNFEKAGLSGRVRIFCMEAEEALSRLNDCRYDMIFLDGPKGKYGQYLKSLKGMLHAGGLLVCDNVLFNGYVSGICVTDDPRYQGIAKKLDAFLKDIMSDDDFLSSIVDIGDGLSVSILRRSVENEND